MRRPIRLSKTALLATLIAASPFARAQTPPPAPPGDRPTELWIDAEGRTSASPDQLTANLFAEANSPSLASAQSSLNALVAKASDIAGSHAATTLTRADYNTYQTGDKPKRWVARQVVVLKSTDTRDGGKAVLDTVSALQAAGLGVDSLDWSISPEKRDTLVNTARTNALHALQEQASHAAAALGMHLVRFQSVRLSTNGEFHPPMPLMMSARMADAPAPAPSSTPQTQDVRVTASGTAILAP